MVLGFTSLFFVFLFFADSSENFSTAASPAKPTGAATGTTAATTPAATVHAFE